MEFDLRSNATLAQEDENNVRRRVVPISAGGEEILSNTLRKRVAYFKGSVKILEEGEEILSNILATPLRHYNVLE